MLALDNASFGKFKVLWYSIFGYTSLSLMPLQKCSQLLSSDLPQYIYVAHLRWHSPPLFTLLPYFLLLVWYLSKPEGPVVPNLSPLIPDSPFSSFLLFFLFLSPFFPSFILYIFLPLFISYTIIAQTHYFPGYVWITRYCGLNDGNVTVFWYAYIHYFVHVLPVQLIWLCCLY